MSQPDTVTTFPAPVLEPPTIPETKFDREYQAFLKLLPGLLQTHPGEYVAVHDGQVVETGADQIAVAKAAWARVGYVPICVRLVTDQPRPVVRIPSFRVIRGR